MARIPKYIRDETKSAYETKRSNERCSMVKQKLEDFRAKHPNLYVQLESLTEKITELEKERSEIKTTINSLKNKAGLTDIQYRSRSGCTFENSDQEIIDFDLETQRISTEIMTTNELDASNYL